MANMKCNMPLWISNAVRIWWSCCAGVWYGWRWPIYAIGCCLGFEYNCCQSIVRCKVSNGIWCKLIRVNFQELFRVDVCLSFGNTRKLKILLQGTENFPEWNNSSLSRINNVCEFPQVILLAFNENKVHFLKSVVPNTICSQARCFFLGSSFVLKLSQRFLYLELCTVRVRPETSVTFILRGTEIFLVLFYSYI